MFFFKGSQHHPNEPFTGWVIFFRPGATACSTRPAKSGLGCSEAIPRGLGLDDDDCGMADGSGGFDDTHDGVDTTGGRVSLVYLLIHGSLSDSYGKW